MSNEIKMNDRSGSSARRPASGWIRTGLRLAIFSTILAGLACGQEFTLPPQPEPQAIPEANEYRIERVWEIDHPTDLVSQGSFLYVIEDTSRVVAYVVESQSPLNPLFVTEFEGLIRPVHLAVAKRDSTYIFVADAGDMRIKRYHFTGGTPRSSFTDTSWVEFSGIAADDRLNVYVSDAPRNVIWKYDADGNRDRVISQRGSGIGFVDGPHGLHFNGSHVLVADTNKNWAQRIEPDLTNVGAEGEPIGFDSPLSAPLDVTADREADFIFVADTGSNTVLKFETTGTFVDTVYAQSNTDIRLGGVPIDQPSYLAAEGKLVFVSDPENNRVVRFILSAEGVGSETSASIAPWPAN